MAREPWLSPERRAQLFQFLLAAGAAALAAFLSRYGIQLPPIPPPIVEITPPVMPPPGGGTDPDRGVADPERAIVRLSFPGVGCTATVIGPRRADGRYWVLTAAHCTERVGQGGTIRLHDGRTVGVSVVNRGVKADWCWMITSSNTEVLPFALLAPATPPAGTKVWHAGFGTHIPGNREDGSILSGPDSNGQIKMRLSVSSGDSGGGIVTDANGHVVSCVCCTSQRGAVADVWGASPEAIRGGQTSLAVVDEWVPTPVPLRMPGKDDPPPP